MSITKPFRRAVRYLGYWAILLLLSGCGERPADAPPNVIVIVADDLGWSDTGAYGSRAYRTPAIDRLAEQGMRFSNAYAASPHCSPTRAALLTGQYPARLGITLAEGHFDEVRLNQTLVNKPDRAVTTPASRNRLPNPITTYAEVLGEHGYVTAFMGKWHLGDPPHGPEQEGFDVVVGGRKHAGPPAPGYFGPWHVDTLPKVKTGVHISDAITDEAISFIRKNQHEPFLLNLWFYDVHAPFQAKPKVMERFAELRAQDRSPTMAAMIATMDKNIGRLLDELNVLDLDQDTIVIFTSDNGGNMYDTLDGTTPTDNAPLRGGKGNNFEGGVRVPLIVRWPDRVTAGTDSGAIVSSVDLFPTLLDLIGIAPRPLDHIDGQSFRLALAGADYDAPAFISYFPHFVVASGSVPNISIREGDWKLYRFFHAGEGGEHFYQLYDLAKDIGEQNNLAANNPEVLSRLDARLERHIVDAGVLVPQLVDDFSATNIWVAGGTASAEAEGAVLKLHSTGEDPMVNTRIAAPFRGNLTLSFEMRSSSEGRGQLFWTDTLNQNLSESGSVWFDPIHDGGWHSYRVDFSVVNQLDRLRLDPARAPGELSIRGMTLDDGHGNSLNLLPEPIN